MTLLGCAAQAKVLFPTRLRTSLEVRCAQWMEEREEEGLRETGMLSSQRSREVTLGSVGAGVSSL